MRRVNWTAAEMQARSTVSPSGCWEWRHGKEHSGYGIVRFRGKSVVAHRVSWTLHRGEIPPATCVLHRCDNRLCVNPDHLFLGDRYDNNADRDAKGRHRPLRGEKNGKAKMNAEAIRLIRHMWSYGFDQDTIGGLFGIKQGYVSHIIKKRVWAHV